MLNAQKNKHPLLKTIIASWMVFFLCLFSGFITPSYNFISPYFLLFFIFGYFLIYIGILFGFIINTNFRKIKIKKSSLIYFTTFCLLLIVLFKFLDRFYLRPVLDLTSIKDFRDSRGGASNFASILSVILSPFGLYAYKICSKDMGRITKIFCLSLLSIYLLDIFFSGSRGILLVVFIILFGDKINQKNLLALIPTLIIFSTLIFFYRFNSLVGGVDDLGRLMASLLTTGYSFFVPASDFYVHIFSSYSSKEPSLILILLYSIIQSIQYLAHGFFEYAYLFSSSSIFEFSPSRFIPQLEKISPTTSTIEREGLYYTFLGSLYIAFGWYSLFAGWLSGVFLGYIYKSTSKINLGARNLTLFSIFLLPYVNSIGGYDIYFFFISFFVFSFLKIDKSSLN